LTGVSDSSPLIALAKVGLLRLLPQLFDDIAIPEAVAAEVLRGGTDESELEALRGALSEDWLSVVSVAESEVASVKIQGLALGESEAIALARRLPESVLIVDDLRARRTAGLVGIRVIGTVGVLVSAGETGLIDAARPVLDDLASKGFRLSPELLKIVAPEERGV
jgi:predicted nucleic acid-binding protein